MSANGYFFSAGHIIGNAEHWDTAWDLPVSYHDSRQAAFDAGWKYHEHDDFVLGLVKDDVLLWVGDLNETYSRAEDEHGETYEGIAAENCWTVSPDAPTEVTS